MNDAPLTVLSKHAWLWQMMREHGVANIIVDFSGSGDIGDIDDITPELADTSGSDAELHLKIHQFLELDFISAGEHSERQTLRELVHDWCDEMLSQNEIPDWVNNDGGNGTVKFVLDAVHGDADFIDITVNQAITTYETSTFSYPG